MPINLNRKYSQVPQKESVPYSDENGSLINWLDNDNVTREGNVFNGSNQLVKTDANGKLPDSVIPDLAITETFVVNTEAEMLALPNVRIGDCCVITSENVTYILRAEPSNVLSNWTEIKVRETPVFTGATSTANGQKGLVKQPLAGDQNKYLKGDGTWYDIGTVLHTDLSNLSETGKDIIKNASQEVGANKDLSNLSETGSKKLVPAGGEANYILAKKTSNTGDFEWIKANLEGCLYDNHIYNLTSDTNFINLPEILSDKKYVTVILDNTVLTSDNYELSADGTALNFTGTITASVDNPSTLEIKYFTSVSVLEQLESATTTYEGKIAIATQNEVDAGTINNKAVVPTTLTPLKTSITNLTNSLNSLSTSVNDKLDTNQKGIANGLATLNNNIKVPLSQIDVNSILQSIIGYDNTKTQILKNINGTFTWVDEAE